MIELIRFLRQPRNFENMTLVHVSHRSESFRDFLANFFDAELPQKKRCFDAQEFTWFLSINIFTALSHALWRVLSNKVIWVLGHCWVNTPHIHTSEWDSLLITYLWVRLSESCLLSTVTVTPSDSDYVNRSACLQLFRFKKPHSLEEYDVSMKWVVIIDRKHFVDWILMGTLFCWCNM